MKRVDIIVPCFNEGDVIELFFNKTNGIVSKIEGCRFEFIFVDDGSSDDTAVKLKKFSDVYDYVKYIFQEILEKKLLCMPDLKIVQEIIVLYLILIYSILRS